MKAVVLNACGDVDQFELKDLPTPIPKKGEVRIKIEAASFNPVDVKMRRGAFPAKLPAILGADCSGVIDLIGEGVSELSVGDAVYAMALARSSNGTYAEYVCLPSAFAVKKPSSLAFEQAACVPLAAQTAYRAVVASGALGKKGSLFIGGAAGGVGSIAVQLAQIFHGGPIFTTAGSEESKDHLVKDLKIPQEHILLYRGLKGEEMAEKLLQLNRGNLFAATFDLVGAEMKKLCLSIADFGGHFATVVPEAKELEIPVWKRGESLAFSKNLSLHYVFVGAEAVGGTERDWSIYREHLTQITQLMNSGKLKPSQVQVVGNLSVKTVQEAHRLLESGHARGKLSMNLSQ